MLVGQDSSTLAQKASDVIDFSSDFSGILPHVAATMNMKAVLEQAKCPAIDVFNLETLHDSLATSEPIPLDVLGETGALYSLMRTAMFAGAASNETIFKDDVGTEFFIGPPSGHPKPDVKLQPLNKIRYVEVTVPGLRTHLAKPVMRLDRFCFVS
ncbi:unnamed protein product [Prorocentrum cordatum]|uniref:Uncharacterized protein n=1 Tax=Prorocentrum cordatum TaxID=2364126 RepID=A0ABN9X9F3_9DINO|nr:unnamed protein product [Polarella glacialis]